MKGTLYLVGTPIGNLEDITYRAVSVLKATDYIFCEDTRHSKILLDKYGIDKKLLSYHKFNEVESSQKIIEYLNKNKNVCLITDAGMPTISDPGAIVVEKAQEEGIKVSVIPGPTAVSSAWALSGITDSLGYTFLGFLQDNKNKRQKQIDIIKTSAVPAVLYVGPHDLKNVIKDLKKQLGDREIILVKEITKIYEQTIKTTLSTFDMDNPKGEFVLIIKEGKTAKVEKNNKKTIKDRLLAKINDGMTEKEAIKFVAKEHRLNKNIVYQILHKDLKDKQD